MKLDPKCISTQAVEKSIQVEISREFSTAVTEKPVMIRNVSTTAAQVSGMDWQIIEVPISQASGLIGQLSTKPEKILKLGDQVSKQIKSTTVQASEHVGQVSTKEIKEKLSTMGDPNEQVSEQTVQVPISKVSEQITSESTASEPSQLSQFGKTIDFLRHVLKEKEKGVSGLQQRVNPRTLYLTDSGSQPEFQELLPALVAGPCVFCSPPS